jgi:hypothetical protein
VYTGYRSGNLKRKNGIFLANKYDGAAEYSKSLLDSEGGKDKDRPFVDTYAVKIEKPFVATNIGDTYEKLFGESIGDLSSGAKWLRSDNKIMSELAKQGYDAWLMTNPAPPADKELVIIGKETRKNMEHTARKVEESQMKYMRERLYGNLKAGKPLQGAHDATPFTTRAEDFDDDILEDMWINRLVHDGLMSEEEALKHGWKKPEARR